MAQATIVTTLCSLLCDRVLACVLAGPGSPEGPSQVIKELTTAGERRL